MKRKSSSHRHQNNRRPVEKPNQAPPPPAPSTRAPDDISVPDELKSLVAGVMLAPEMAAAQSMSQMMDLCLKEAGMDLPTVAGMLTTQGEAVAEGDLAQVQRSLASQVTTMEHLFHHLFNIAVAAQKDSHDQYERYLRLAMKAQAQSARTAHILGRLTAPPRRMEKPKPEPKPAPVEAAPQEASPPLPVVNRLSRHHAMAMPPSRPFKMASRRSFQVFRPFTARAARSPRPMTLTP